MNRILLVLLVLAMALAPSGSSGGERAVSEGPVEVRFSYSGPAAWSGEFDGSCKAAGLRLDRENRILDFTANGGELLLRWTRVNFTVVNPEQSPWVNSVPDRQWTRTEKVPPGAGRLSWDASDGLVSAFSQMPGSEENLGLVVDYQASELRAGPVDVRGDVPSWWTSTAKGELFLSMLDYPGWNRELRHVGAADVSGNVTFYLRHSMAQLENWESQLPAYGTIESEVRVPYATHQTIVYADAFLTLDSARFQLPEAGVAVCRTLAGDHHGSFAAALASGEARSGAEVLQFEDRALSLEGRFAIHEQPADIVPSTAAEGATEARAHGAITVVGIDFARVGGTGAPPSAVAVGLVAAALLAAAAAIYKWGGAASAFLYSRLSRDEVLETARREALLQAVRASPGIAQKDLRAITEMPWTSLRYHLRVLHRAGFVSVARYGLSRRIFARDTTPKVDPATLALVADDRLAFVQSLLRSGPVPLKDVVQAIRERFGVSMPRAYASIDRAVKVGLARKQRTFPGVALALPEEARAP